ncbi:hypothetical protein PoB_005959700 [Plakobranchus ocellatus]|uniref:Uncharacterized protein n=1 Tax=Plakobranchus ocellatus TaxID=259542 RepID=A0AAV4CMX7_9GAST|nr:hypothetical protein PoB_005959700 [Plakobranchus ocellatus]
MKKKTGRPRLLNTLKDPTVYQEFAKERSGSSALIPFLTQGLCVPPVQNKVISGQGAGCWARTRDRRVPVDLRADSLAIVPPTPLLMYN